MRWTLLAMLICLAAPASPQDVTSRTAAAQLFASDSKIVQVSGSLSKKEHGTIKALLPLMEQQMQGAVSYYSSIAYAPDQGLVSDALQGAFNHHSVEAADRAALRACTAAKPRGAGGCRIAARILPRGYEKRPLTLSASATQAFERRFTRLAAPKSFAISPSTGAWGLGRDDRTAINGCRRSGASDCRVTIRN